MKNVTVIDYGIGNVLSVQRAFEYCGANVVLTDDRQAVENADYLVLPGVGAFADGMRELNSRDLVEPIKRYTEKDRPFLGICLGMQMMLDLSEEFGEHKGLELIKGKVVRISDTGLAGNGHKVPHIGWYGLYPANHCEQWQNTILSNSMAGTEVYFVHSYMAKPEKEENCLAYYKYDDQKICAVIKEGLIYGCQFHPEKSGKIGLNMIRSFLML